MIPQPLDQVPLFARLSEEERELVSSRLRHLEYNTNDLIFTANKPAELFGIVVQGWVKLEGESPQGRVALASLGAGSLIGEVDMLLGRAYSTSARAASTCNILALNRQDLQDLILQHPAIGLKFSTSLGTRVAYLDQYLVTQRLLSAPLLSALAESELRALANHMQFRSLERGETIFEAGQPGDAVYLLESGSARLITHSREGESYDELHEGDLFGQTALITAKPYPSTAKAITDVNAWVLHRDDFHELIRQHPSIKLAFSSALAERLGSDDQARAVETLQAMPLFADADQSAITAIAEHLVLRHYPAGETIYTEGTPGDAMYFVESGRVRLVSDAATEHELLERKGPGESFGEMALLTGRTRAEAAKAAEDTTLWVLYKSEYDDLIVQHPALSLALSRALSNRLGTTEGEFVERHLRKLALFGGLAQTELREIAAFVKPLRFRPGETVCLAGQPAQNVYIVESGELRAIAAGPGGQLIVLDLLGPQQSFGEQAVVQSATYPVTVQAVGDVELWAISKTDFDRLLERYPALALTITRRMADELDRATRRSGRVQPRPAMPAYVPPSMRGSGVAPTAIPQNGQAYPPYARGPAGPAPIPPGFAPRPASNGRVPPSPQPLPTASVGVRSAPSRPWERSGNIVRPMPAATARPVNAAPANLNARMAPGYAAPIQRPGPIQWFMNLSPGNKIATLLISLFALWIVVMLPLWLLVSLLTAGSSAAGSNSPAPNELPFNFNVGGRQVNMLPGKIAQRIKTATPIPPTPTPIPPTAVPTRRPTARPVVKQAAEASPEELAAQEAQANAAPAAPARPLPPVEWDSRLGSGGLPLLQGVGIEKAEVPSGQSFWRLVKMKFEDAGAESGNDHTIYVTLIDENGQRVEDQSIEISWDESGSLEAERLMVSDQKPRGDYCLCNYNWPMYGAGYRVKVDGNLPSDRVVGMIMPMKRHVNYRLTFQRVVMP